MIRPDSKEDAADEVPEAEPRLSKELLRRVGIAAAAAVGGEG